VNERGSVSVVILGLMGLLVVLGVMLGTTGQYLSVRSRVQAAADAAALAAAPVTFHPFGSSGDPAAEAARFAAANGARLIRCVCAVDRSWESRIVQVEVGREVDLIGLGRIEIRASAAAEFAPIELLEDRLMD
jgi:secretion/DNA translocation related TadE-like protein